MDPEIKSEFAACTPTQLRELYENKASLFAELADDAIRQACIGRTPEQTLKLRRMQWTIDGQLRKAKTPLERMHIMESIFYGQVYGDDGQLVKLVSACTELLRAINRTDQASESRSSKQQLYVLKRTSS